MSTLTEQAPTVVCTMSFAAGREVGHRGELYRADHPLVRAYPKFFAPPDTPEAEWPTPFDGAVAATEAREKALEAERQQARIEQANQNPVRLQAPAVFRAVRDVVDLSQGRKVLKGSTVLEGELVAEHPNDFKLV